MALLVGGGVLGTYLGSSLLGKTPADVSADVFCEGAAAALGAEGELAHLPGLLERLRAVPGIDEAGFVSKTQVSIDLDESAAAEAGDGGCIVVNEVADARRGGERPFSGALRGTRISLVGTSVSWEVAGLLDEAPEWLWLSRGELESVLPTVPAPASSVAGVDRGLVGYGMTTLYVTAQDSGSAAEDVRRLLEDDPALAAWYGVVDERAQSRQTEVLFAALDALSSALGVTAAAVGLASAFNASAASILLRSRDLAVLHSAGMGERELRRMLACECARTAAAGLALGLLLALALNLWIYAQGGIAVRSLGFVVPWAHVVGAETLVALVLLASCAYALRRLRLVPLLDALRAG